LSGQILQNRVYFQNRFDSITPELIVKGAWVSTALALILTIPALMTFVGLYYSTSSVILGAIAGFSLHFASLAFATRITGALESLFT
jgi:hypothetical protein